MMNKLKPYILDTTLILCGTLLLALGINLFLTANKISSGGISTVGTILLYWFGIKMSVTNIVMNALLFLLGFQYLGKYAMIKTGIGILFLTLFLELTLYLPHFTEDLLLTSVTGGALIGVGIGLVFRRGASTGGSDLAALIIHRFFPHVSLANLILIMDSAVIILSGLVFQSFSVTMYSIIAMYISSRVADAIVTLGDVAKTVRVFSPRAEHIARIVMERFGRGITGIPCRGMYSQRDGMMLLCVVSPKELPPLVGLIKQIDANAFVIIHDAREVLGEGFKEKNPYAPFKNHTLK